MKPDIIWKRILLYVIITFTITYALEFAFIGNILSNASGNKGGPAPAASLQMITACMMFIPAVGVIITRIMTKEGKADLWIKPSLKGKMKYYVMAWFGPAIITLLGCTVFFLVFPGKFDKNMSYMAETYRQLGANITSDQLRLTMVSQLIMAVAAGPVLNILNSFGEELGWRGYLLPKLASKFRILPTLLISGVIWGLWHAPLTYLIGHNYGFGYPGYPFTGILAMCIFCIAFGTVLSYLTLKTGSCIAASLAHGAFNAIAAIGIFFLPSGSTPNPFLGPSPTGIVGGSILIITAIILAILLKKEESSAHAENPSK